MKSNLGLSRDSLHYLGCSLLYGLNNLHSHRKGTKWKTRY